MTLVCRSDYPKHAVCLPHEDQEGVALLRAHPPPAGQILRRSSCHPANGQHLLHGTNGSRNHSVPALTSLPALPPGEGCVCPAPAHGGTLLWRVTSWRLGGRFLLQHSRCVCGFFLQVFELYRLLAVGISLWNQFAVPVLFSVFWFVLFIVQLCSDTMDGNAPLGHQGILFFLLTRCRCCSPPPPDASGYS